MPGKYAGIGDADKIQLRLERKPDNRIGGGQDEISTAFQISKVVLGAGGFAMPWAFAKSGLPSALFAIGGCVGFGSFSVSELMRAKRRLEKSSGVTDATYVDIARDAFGEQGASLVYSMTLICSLGVTTAYIAFMTATTCSLLELGVDYHTPISVMVGFTVAPLTMIQGSNLIATLAQYGTYAVLIGYMVTMYYVYTTGKLEIRDAAAWVAPSWESFGESFGSIAFLFAVHFLLFPIHSASADRDREGRFEGTAAKVFVATGIANACFGAVGYIAFGPGVSSIVVNDIDPSVGVYLVATKLMLILDLVASYPLVFAAGRQIVERSLFESEEDDPFDMNGRRLFVRAVMVSVTVILAQFNDFGGIINLVGGFAQASLAFVLPSAIALQSVSLGKDKMDALRVAMNLLLLALGTAVAVGTTIFALKAST